MDRSAMSEKDIADLISQLNIINAAIYHHIWIISAHQRWHVPGAIHRGRGKGEKENSG